MNALADKVYMVYKQGMPHSDMHSITWPHPSTIIHPFVHIYVACSGMPVDLPPI